MLVDEVDLGDGRSIAIRHAEDGDIDGLMALYERLSPEDLHRRFFSGGVPARDTVEKWALMKHRDGGIALVAEYHCPDASPLLIGEAGCAPLPDGDAELGISLDPDHRGWFGAFFLETLLQEAAAYGYQNVQALILTGNAGMRAVLCHRGAAAMPDQDWTTARYTIGTHGNTPSWPPRQDLKKKRLLVESRRLRWPGTAEANNRGFDVLVCGGPDTKRGHCPALEGSRCPLVDGADAVVLDIEPEAGGDSLAAAHRAADRGNAGPVVIRQSDHSTGAALDALAELGDHDGGITDQDKS